MNIQTAVSSVSCLERVKDVIPKRGVRCAVPCCDICTWKNYTLSSGFLQKVSCSDISLQKGEKKTSPSLVSYSTTALCMCFSVYLCLIVFHCVVSCLAKIPNACLFATTETAAGSPFSRVQRPCILCCDLTMFICVRMEVCMQDRARERVWRHRLSCDLDIMWTLRSVVSGAADGNYIQTNMRT